MTPETSSDRSAPLTARRLPIASMLGCHWLNAALVVDTVCGGDPIALMYFLIIMPLNAWNPNTAPSTMATAISMITMRLVIT